MDDQFAHWTRILAAAASRRVALQTLVGSAIAARLGRLGVGEVAAKKKRTKLKKNEFGCVDVGSRCRGKDAVCCSGICQGKKPKKGQKDKSRCVAHNVLDCQPGADSCEGDVSCGTFGICMQTTGKASFCASSVKCRACKKDADCEPEFGPGAACAVCPDTCPLFEGSHCLGPAAP